MNFYKLSHCYELSCLDGLGTHYTVSSRSCWVVCIDCSRLTSGWLYKLSLFYPPFAHFVTWSVPTSLGCRFFFLFYASSVKVTWCEFVDVCKVIDRCQCRKCLLWCTFVLLHSIGNVIGGGSYWVRQAVACPLFAPCGLAVSPARPLFGGQATNPQHLWIHKILIVNFNIQKMCQSAPKHTFGILKTKKYSTPRQTLLLTASALVRQIWPAHFWDASTAYGKHSGLHQNASNSLLVCMWV